MPVKPHGFESARRQKQVHDEAVQVIAEKMHQEQIDCQKQVDGKGQDGRENDDGQSEPGTGEHRLSHVFPNA